MGDCNVPTLEELNAMTLQVGLVGSDGVVIASDRLMSQFEGSGFTQITTSKFLSGSDSVCCYAGDIVAQHAAYHVRDSNCRGDKEELRQTLIEAGNKAWRECGGPGGLSELGISRKVIVAFRNSPSPLWLLQIFKTSIANEVMDKVVAGDDKNTARHFSNNYVPYPPLPISKLINLAAHVVLVGGKENPSGVRGLEVVVIPRGESPIFLSKDQEDEMEQRFQRTDSSFGKRLTSPYTFRQNRP
jgi:hypothetical protein